MKERFTEFLVDKNKAHPKSLTESIRNITNLSAGFCRSWGTQRIQDAIHTSEQAFSELDHLQSELLRHRDERRASTNWSIDPLKLALEKNAGEILTPATQTDIDFFRALPVGQAGLPPNSNTKKLTLVAALNKLKHRSPDDVNFSISDTGAHTLYFYTKPGMSQPGTISCFDVEIFCDACREAATKI